MGCWGGCDGNLNASDLGAEDEEEEEKGEEEEEEEEEEDGTGEEDFCADEAAGPVAAAGLGFVTSDVGVEAGAGVSILDSAGFSASTDSVVFSEQTSAAGVFEEEPSVEVLEGASSVAALDESSVVDASVVDASAALGVAGGAAVLVPVLVPVLVLGVEEVAGEAGEVAAVEAGACILWNKREPLSTSRS